MALSTEIWFGVARYYPDACPVGTGEYIETFDTRREATDFAIEQAYATPGLPFAVVEEGDYFADGIKIVDVYEGEAS